MRKFIIAQMALIAISSSGAMSEQCRSSVMYWIDSVSYAQDEIVDFLQTNTGENTRGHEDEHISSISDERVNTNTSAIGASGKVEGDVSQTSGGKPAAKVGMHVEVSAETKFTWEKKHIEQTQSKKRAWEKMEEKVRQYIRVKKSDWKLRFNINFKNESKTQTLVYKRGEDSGAIINITDIRNWEIHRIKVQPLELSPAGFELQPNGNVTLTVNATIPNSEIKQLLLTAQACGELDQCVAIEFDDLFRMTEKDTNMTRNFRNSNACRITTIGFGKKSIEVVNYSGLTYKEILCAATNSLPLSFKSDGSLDTVYDQAFGRYGSDNNGVYVVLMEEHGKLKDYLSKKELDMRPRSCYDNNDLRFVRIGLKDLYDNYVQCPCSVISNCFSYVGDSRDVRDEDLFVCAMLAKERQDYALMGRCLSRIKDIGKFLNDANSKSLALSLLIKADNPEYFGKCFEKLDYLDWAYTNRTMLGFAAEIGSSNIVRYLLEECPDNKRVEVDGLVSGATKKSIGDAGKTPLFWAAKNGHLEVCKYLVSKGADITREFYEEFYEENKSKKTKEKYDELVKDKYISDLRIREYINAERDLFKVRDRWWRWCGSVPSDATGKKIRQWIKAGVSPDSYLGRHWNLLSWAVALRDINLVTFLINNGADVKGKYSACPSDGYTALMLACERGNTYLADKLISKRVDLYSKQDNGMMAFHCAIKSKNYDCCDMLSRNGLDVSKCPRVRIDGEWIDPVKYENVKPLFADALRGNAESMNELGCYYGEGNGVYKDWNEAVVWFRKAAAKNLPEAHYNLYLCYSNGTGVTKNKTKAEWHRKRAEELGYYTYEQKKE